MISATGRKISLNIQTTIKGEIYDILTAIIDLPSIIFHKLNENEKTDFITN